MLRITPEVLAKTILLASYGIIKSSYNIPLSDTIKRRMQFIMSRPEFQREYFILINRLRKLPVSLLNNIGRRFVLITESKNNKKIKIKLIKSNKIVNENKNFDNAYIIPPFIKKEENKIINLFEYYVKEKNFSKNEAIKKLKENFKNYDIKNILSKSKIYENQVKDEFLNSFENFLVYVYNNNKNIKFMKIDKLIDLFLSKKKTIEFDKKIIIDFLKNRKLNFIKNIYEDKNLIEFNRDDEKSIKKTEEDIEKMAKKAIKNRLN